MAERLACEDVRQVDFDERNGYARQRIAQGDAGVRVRTGVDQDVVDTVAASLLDAVDQFAFMVALERGNAQPGRLAAFDEAATPEALRALEQDPFDDDGAAKRTLRGAITGTRAEKLSAYLAMRRAIVAARAARAAELASMRTRIAANRDAIAAHALANDRTWPFPFAVR